jgi:hypothetical protein
VGSNVHLIEGLEPTEDREDLVLFMASSRAVHGLMKSSKPVTCRSSCGE